MKLTDTMMMVNDINIIAEFLAKRDINSLDAAELYNKFGIKQVDIIILLGNSIPYTAKKAAAAYKNRLSKRLMIAGGIGHSTKYLTDNIRNDSQYKNIDLKDKTEADIFNQLILKWGDINENDIIIENQSTNCGSNAKEALKVLKQNNNVPKSILLIQDPTMQQRSHASFLKEWREEDTLIISYSPFIPKLSVIENGYEYSNDGVKYLWSKDRFIDLIMGEIPRLRDDEQGYGPKGKGFITHVDLPKQILDSFERLLNHFAQYYQIKDRKSK